MVAFVVTVLARDTGAFRSVEVLANSADKAKERVIWGLSGSDTVYDVRLA